MLSEDMINEAAAALDQAEATRTPIPPLSATYSGLDEADAYAIQKSWVGRKLERGSRIKGHKIGLTSRAMQRVANFDQPDYGTILDDMLYEDGATIPSARYITPLLECELAFILKRPLKGSDVTIFDVMDATAYVVPALEIVDLRTLAECPEGRGRRTIFDNISDNAANAALVLGGSPVRPDGIDLSSQYAICRRNLVVEESGVSAAVLNHPARGVEWLVHKLAAHDQGLEAGEIVLGGSFTRVVEARSGDQFYVDYGPLGSVTCSFQ